MKKRLKFKKIFIESEVDLTPLIDCVFLLLIFFMVTTVFIEVQGLIVDLPSTDQAQEEQQQKKKDVNILVSASGEYTVSGSTVSKEFLADAIMGAMDENNNRNVIIQGDTESKHGAIVYVMDMATKVGAEQMAFAVEQADEDI